MTKKYEYSSLFKILANGIKIYITHFALLSRVMLFPVFGQLAGICLILVPAFFLSKMIPQHFTQDFIIDNFLLILLGMILAVTPGFVIFLKAFWEYMIAMVSLNSISGNIIKNGNIKDIGVHSQSVKLKSKDYVSLLLLLSLIWAAGLFAPFLVFGAQSSIGGASMFSGALFVGLEILSVFLLFIASVYLSLCYQVFAYENLNAVGTIKKSWNLIEGNFWRALLLGVILAIITCLLVPSLFQSIIDKTPLMSYIIIPFKSYFSSVIGDSGYSYQISANLQKIMPTVNPGNLVDMLSEFSASTLISGIVTSFMLPLGSACYTLLYFNIVTKRSIKAKK